MKIDRSRTIVYPDENVWQIDVRREQSAGFAWTSVIETRIVSGVQTTTIHAGKLHEERVDPEDISAAFKMPETFMSGAVAVN